MKTILSYLKNLRGKMSVVLLIKIFGTLSELMLPYILSHILKNVITKGIKSIVLWGVLMIVCSAVACVCNIVANRMAAAVSKVFAKNMRNDLFRKTLYLSAKQTDDFTIPSLESRITSDTYNVHNFVNMMQRMGVRAPILLIGGLGITMVMDMRLALVMIAILPFMFATIFCISSKGIPLYTKVQKSVDRMVRVVREDVQGMRVIKALSKSDYEHKRYDNVNRELIGKETRAGVIMGTVNPIMSTLMNIGSVGVIALGAYWVGKGLSDAENIIAFMQYFNLISMAMMGMTRMFMMYTKFAASSKRIAEVLNTPEDITLASKDEYPDISTDKHIVFKDVHFSYTGKYENLKNINFEIKKGGSLGIIGATGCGKSTIVKLLMRFYDVTQGNIYIDGEDIRTIEHERLYSMFGSAMQYDFLYADTIEENIAFGRDIPHQDIVEAVKTAQAYEFIKEFEDGYDHMLSQHGANISGGQKQRTLISRALAGTPSIVVLDDSSSALDYRTDAKLRKALGENLENTTVITVAQRVSSVKDCTTILVVEKGEIIGLGTHDYLMANCAEYKEISDSQMGGAFVD